MQKITKNRKEENIKEGFNLVVLDVDGTATIRETSSLLKSYSYIIQTTKRHTKDSNRFRIVIPLSHELKLDKENYTTFMNNIYDWLPIAVDSSTSDRCRAWFTNEKAEFVVNKGKPLNVFQFIPNTRKNNTMKKNMEKVKSLPALERWFILNTEDGDRNNKLLRYALSLVDLGKDYDDITARVYNLNAQLDSPLTEDRILKTVLVTVARKLGEK